MVMSQDFWRGEAIKGWDFHPASPELLPPLVHHDGAELHGKALSCEADS